MMLKEVGQDVTEQGAAAQQPFDTMRIGAQAGMNKEHGSQGLLGGLVQHKGGRFVLYPQDKELELPKVAFLLHKFVLKKILFYKAIF